MPRKTISQVNNQHIYYLNDFLHIKQKIKALLALCSSLNYYQAQSNQNSIYIYMYAKKRNKERIELK
jgi:hypothetical protein